MVVLGNVSSIAAAASPVIAWTTRGSSSVAPEVRSWL